MHEAAVFQVLVCNPCSARSLARLIPRNDDDDDVLEDFRSEYEALNRVRIKGFHELLEEAKLLQNGSKELWRLKAKLFDLLWQKLEPVMSQVQEGEQLAGAKSELAERLQEDGLVGVFPVGGAWGGTSVVDVRTRPGLQALRLNFLVCAQSLHRHSKKLPQPEFGMWVPVSAAEMKKRKRCQSGTHPAA